MLGFLPSKDGVTAAGLACGILLGYLFEDKYVKFTTEGLPWKQKALRFGIGILLVLAAYLVPKLLLPGDILVLRYLRYALVSFVAAGLAPFVFTKCKC